MLRKILISMLTLFFIFNSVNAFSAQYENYKWGISKKEAIKKVKENECTIVDIQTYKKDNTEVIKYIDELFGKKIGVTMLFTPKSKKLCNISISSYDTVIGKNLKPILKDKYGKPTRFNEDKEVYFWKEDGSISIVLKYDNNTKIYYYSNKYYPDIYEQEKQKLNKKEADDKF